MSREEDVRVFREAISYYRERVSYIQGLPSEATEYLDVRHRVFIELIREKPIATRRHILKAALEEHRASKTLDGSMSPDAVAFTDALIERFIAVVDSEEYPSFRELLENVEVRIRALEHAVDRLGEEVGEQRQTGKGHNGKELYARITGAVVGAVFIGADLVDLHLGLGVREWLGGNSSIQAGAMLFLFIVAPTFLGK